MATGTEHRKAWPAATLGAERVAHPALAPLEALVGLDHGLLLLAFLAQDRLVRVADALALVGLGLAEAPDLGRNLADPLPVGAADRDRGWSLADDLHVFGDRELDVVAVTELQVEDPSVDGGTVADTADLQP